MNKRLTIGILLISALAMALVSYAGAAPKATETNFKAPTVALDSIQLDFYEGFWTYGKAETAMGKAPAGGGSAAVTLNFIFNITNPNAYDVKLDSSKFFLFFEDYELRVVNDNNSMWIPPGKTNSKTLSVTLTPVSTFGKFILVHAQTAKEKGINPWELIEKWWNGLPDMAFPIHAKEGNFVFSADGVTKVVPIEAKYP